MAFGLGFSLPAYLGYGGGFGAGATLVLDFTSGNQTLDPRVTFSRASNATVTGSNGLVQYAPNNLLTYSQQFDNAAWSKTNATVTADSVTAPDGSLSADALVDNAVSGQHRANNSVAVTVVSGASYTFSFYAKQNTIRYINARIITTTGNAQSTFDLQTGTVSGTSVGTATISAAGNGWFRCTVTGTTDGTSAFAYVNLNASANVNPETYVGTGSSAYIWGAQLNTGALQTYWPTVASAYYGPRFDYNPVTLAPNGLLIEEQRTNLLTYSEQFENAIWTGAIGSKPAITANSVVSPNGTTTADSLNYTGQYQAVCQAIPSTAVEYTFSIWLRIDSGTRAISVANGNGVILTTFTVTNTWARFSGTFTSNHIVIGLQDRNTSRFVTVYAWGAQLEAGAFPTSYIPTVAAQVTRAADVATMTGTNFSSWYNATEGAVYTEFAKSWLSSTATTPFQLTPTSGGQGIMGWINTDGLNFRQWVGGTSTTLGSLSASATNKAVVAYGSTNAGSLNGAAAVANAGTVPVDITSATIGKYGTGYLNGTIKRIAYYPRRLSNSELQAITA